MRKFFTSTFVGVALLVGAPSIAQAQCLLCGIVGYMIGSAGSANAVGQQQFSGGGGAVLYVAPRITERIRDPLDVRFASTHWRQYNVAPDPNCGNHRFCMSYRKGTTIQSLFNETVENADKYVILEVVRLFLPTDQTSAIFWFAYLEKEKVIPLEKLPAPVQN